MWKLTIYQKKPCNGWESKQEVSFISDDAGELLDIADYLSQRKPEHETSYELKELKKEQESRFLEPVGEKEEE